MLRFEDQFDYQITCHPQLEAEDLEVPPLTHSALCRERHLAWADA
jgi:hypothetical protein